MKTHYTIAVAAFGFATLFSSFPALGQFVQRGPRLVGTGAVGGVRQGVSVAVSADGNTAIVGGPKDSPDGAAWIWTLDGGVWTQQGTKLVASGASGNANQGSSVAISADGQTAVVGGNNDSGGVGAVWVWTRSGELWTQQGNKLVGAAAGISYQGDSVSLSANGNTLVVGGHYEDGGTGAAWVWTRSGGVWTQQGAKLVGSGTVGVATQGRSVALSADGNTAVVGGDFDNSSTGAAWVWTRSGGVWTQQGAKLVGSDAVGGIIQQGFSVSISADGNTVIVGGQGDNGFVGAAWVWTRSGGVWTQQGTKLVGSGAAGIAGQGYSVCMSSDGSTAIIGGNDEVGGAQWVWTRSGGIWTQQGPKLITSGADSASLSGDGNTAVIGGSAGSPDGAAWVWSRSGGTWSQQGGTLIGSGAVGNAEQGKSISLSSDGGTAIVGAPSDSPAGAAWVWRRDGGVWIQQGTKLVGSGTAGTAFQGYSVSLSADGNTAIVGGWADSNSVGAAWVWTRSAGAWSQQGTKLVGTGAAGIAFQGVSVSLSADGNTAIVGGPGDNGNAGAVWIWIRSGGVWTQQGTKLTGSGAVGIAGLGNSVSLSADGNTALVGGYADNSFVGAAWVWTRSGGTWSQQLGKLVGSDGIGIGRQGWSVSLSADGNTAIVGGPSDNGDAGAAWVWTRSGGVWTQQTTKLVGSGAVGNASQGVAVSVSANGNTAIIGGNRDDDREGAAWVWTRSGGLWTELGKLVGSDSVEWSFGNEVFQGASVSLSADGNTAIVGGNGDNGGAGAAWVFANSAVPAIPTEVSAAAITTTLINVEWTSAVGAVSYQVDRQAAGGEFLQVGTSGTNSYSDNTVGPNSAYMYRVRGVNAAGVSWSSSADLATTVIFTDDPVIAGSTRVKAVHVTELRTAVDAVRSLAGLGGGTYSDATLTGVAVKALHIAQLRTELDAARRPLGLSTGGYTDTSLTGIAIKAVHLGDLRDRVK